MNALLKWLAACLTLPPLVVFGGAWFLLEDKPLVPTSGLRSDARPDPYQHRLDVAVGEWSRRTGLPVAARIGGLPPFRHLIATLKTPLPRPYLNVDLRLEWRQSQLHVREARVGGVSLPAALVEAVLPLRETRVSAPPPASDNPLSLMAADTRLLQKYYDRLWRWDRHWQKHGASLLTPLRLLFAHARRYTMTATAAAEHRALLQILAVYTNKYDPARLFALKPRGELRYPRLTLQGRHDLAQHFVTAAAVSASGGAGLARYLGLYKELSDFDTGSGFSFSDLAADMAGTRFGRLAVTSPGYLQRQLLRLDSERGLLPSLKGLPDHLSRTDFQRRFGHTGSPAYRRLLAVIERRIDALPLYRHASP
ncbi:hypothetical protein MIT9_P1530 [Methylomarinovum caldicuralii]|uniref:Uncharacterized protein n=1 Tax=Methylomarinovum caldicuralii TaxID=438856 RepID=A0AAU9BSR9_9GAMM|nr:hypothetical protein [Methylomarinovum caldicuralii]BCX81948.1 hypothetical protein MIT9_P1530 [Methylomarinovum caldicuralii]